MNHHRHQSIDIVHNIVIYSRHQRLDNLSIIMPVHGKQLFHVIDFIDGTSSKQYKIQIDLVRSYRGELLVVQLVSQTIRASDIK